MLAHQGRLVVGILPKAEFRLKLIAAKRPHSDRGFRGAPEFAIALLNPGLAAFPFEEILEALFN